MMDQWDGGAVVIEARSFRTASRGKYMSLFVWHLQRRQRPAAGLAVRAYKITFHLIDQCEDVAALIGTLDYIKDDNHMYIKVEVDLRGYGAAPLLLCSDAAAPPWRLLREFLLCRAAGALQAPIRVRGQVLHSSGIRPGGRQQRQQQRGGARRCLGTQNRSRFPLTAFSKEESEWQRPVHYRGFDRSVRSVLSIANLFNYIYQLANRPSVLETVPHAFRHANSSVLIENYAQRVVHSGPPRPDLLEPGFEWLGRAQQSHQIAQRPFTSGCCGCWTPARGRRLGGQVKVVTEAEGFWNPPVFVCRLGRWLFSYAVPFLSGQPRSLAVKGWIVLEFDINELECSHIPGMGFTDQNFMCKCRKYFHHGNFTAESKARKNRVIKAAVWILLELFLLGVAMLYATVFLMYLQPSYEICFMIPWFREIGFAVTYGTLVVKIYRILCSFQSRKAHRVHVRDRDLLKYLGGIVTVATGFMAAWTAATLDHGRRLSGQTGCGQLALTGQLLLEDGRIDSDSDLRLPGVRHRLWEAVCA
uniref:G_PROTEIN_RECEP_F3_4 domain-containing protein n=1 Tax=Macrostomum lignano TaxID=282301 RepID=A0A1I8FE27_9PLAT